MATADQFLTQLAQARAQGDSSAARAILARALAEHPSDPRIRNTEGMLSLADGDPLRAAAAFRQAIAADPDQPALHLNLATACRQAGDDAGEAAALQQILDRDQLDFMGQLRMAELRQRKGDGIAAAQHWSAVVQLAAGMDAPTAAVREAQRRGAAFLADHAATFEAKLRNALRDSAPLGRRFAACVDTMLGRRRIFVNHCEGIHFPFLPADEFFERAHFPWMPQIEAHTAAIRDEAVALIAARNAPLRPYVQLAPGTPDNPWTALDQSTDWSAVFLWEYGTRNEAVCAACPATTAALSALPLTNIPGNAPNAFFSILAPGAHIPPHTGVTNTRAIVHLPLVVPDGCTFRVGGETRAWVEGDAFAFDDTIEHEAINRSDRPRIVLIFDVWNPHLTLEEQAQLQTLFSVAR